MYLDQLRLARAILQGLDDLKQEEFGFIDLPIALSPSVLDIEILMVNRVICSCIDALGHIVLDRGHQPQRQLNAQRKNQFSPVRSRHTV